MAGRVVPASAGGLIGSLVVFAAALFVVFAVSGWLDQMTTARLADALAGWQPESTAGVVARAVVDGLIGLTGIVVPYMIPLVLLLFLTFYIPCISTFAVMNKTIGRRDALFSVLLSVSVALAVSGAVRALLQGARWFAA